MNSYHHAFATIKSPALASLLTFALITAAPTSNAAPRDVSESTTVNTRVDYLSKLLQSRTGVRLSEYNGGDTYRQVEQLLQQARTTLAAGDAQTADQLARQGFSTIMSAIKEMPDDPEIVQQQQDKYNSLKQTLRKLHHAHQDNADGQTQYDTAAVATLKQNAEAAANRDDYSSAINKLTQAHDIITASIRGMLNNKTLVHELDLSTPEKEYFYELRRYLGYEELVPIAIETKQPTPEVADKMLALGDRARWMADQASQRASDGDYPYAIRMIMDATGVVQEALGMAGVTM